VEDIMRGAELLVKTLHAAGIRRVFTLSGNQIMPVFDACIDADIKLIHVRHEAASVHMADAWGRLTGEPGITLVTAGPGFANALSALYVTKMAESPMILLSGHAPLGQLGRGAFQEMAQAEMAGPIAKASWTASDASKLGQDIRQAFKIATSGRPGPVHISLPFDLLEAQVQQASVPQTAFRVEPASLSAGDAQQVLDALSQASRPLVLTGPAITRGVASEAASELAARARVSIVGMESPRGVNDPSLGAFTEVLSQADLIVLLGKKLDFMLQFGNAPAISADCRFIQIDPEQQAIEHTRKLLGGSSRLLMSFEADTIAATKQLSRLASGQHFASQKWYDAVQEAIAYRPPEWASIKAAPDKPIHAVEVCRAIQKFLDQDKDSIYISDGGEFGQWAQACLSIRRRIINGPSGAIGSAIPFTIAAREACPNARIVTMLGDGTFGFHPAEFDTAFRYNLPFIAVVGNDATWNAEYQIQLRSYGPDRLVGCELLPTRYDEVTRALGGYGEHVTSESELSAALGRAYASGLPACINVSLERNAAPGIRRKKLS
jgi:acetolactate synthase-1/2/3 large subunit